MTTPRAILIAGPTASGKSGLALSLAERLRGVVINADSMQVYEDLAVLTARPTPEDVFRVPHALYGFVPGSTAYSTGRYIQDAARAIAEAHTKGQRPIFVGGTGLYFTALLEGLSPIPPVSGDVRQHWRKRAQAIGTPALARELAQRDPELAARLSPNDTQRITRALEVIEATGESLADWQKIKGTPVLDERETIRLVITPEREDLYRRCDARLDAMLAGGAVHEVEVLAAKNLDPTLPVMGALGVRPLMQALKGQIELEQAATLAKNETRQYGKRQLTWLKSHMMSWKSITAQLSESNIREIVSFVDS